MFGITGLELFSRSAPYADVQDLTAVARGVIDGTLKPPVLGEDKCPRRLFDLLTRCCSLDPKQRPAMVEVHCALKDIADELRSGTAPDLTAYSGYISVGYQGDM